MNARDYLAGVPFFSGTLTEDELESLAATTRRVDFAPGDLLIHEDDEGETMFVVMKGTISVTIEDAGKQRAVATLGEGEIVGEISMLTGAPRSATVQATTPVSALEIDRAAIGPLLIAEPTLFDRFADMLEKRRGQLDRIYGPGAARFYGGVHDDLAIVMRTFFSSRTRG